MKTTTPTPQTTAPISEQIINGVKVALIVGLILLVFVGLFIGDGDFLAAFMLVWVMVPLLAALLILPFKRLVQSLGLFEDPDVWRDWRTEPLETPVAMTASKEGRPSPDFAAVIHRDQSLPRRNKLARAYRYPRIKLIRGCR